MGVKSKTNSDGYDLVLSQFGKPHGAKTRLAEALGVTRAVVHRWKEYGIPHKYSRDIQRITGLKFADIWPEDA